MIQSCRERLIRSTSLIWVKTEIKTEVQKQRKLNDGSKKFSMKTLDGFFKVIKKE
mgnify:CR=1 FL=1